MNRDERALARHLFQLKIHKANGQEFENIFTSIMSYRYLEFQQIKPWGADGDRKNDGYIRSKGIFFQVYAPEEISKSYNTAVRKVENDFHILLEKWNGVNEFYFVVNDKYQGINAACDQTMESIRLSNNLTQAGFKTAKDLEDWLFSLNDDQITAIIGFLPDPAKIQLDYSILSEVLRHIMAISLPTAQDSPINLPDWDRKITFNGLTDLPAKYLNNGFLQIGALDEYLSNNSNTFADEVKTKLREIYMKFCGDFSGDDLFWELVNTISTRAESSIQSAAIILISKYFETCDVFEEPQ